MPGTQVALSKLLAYALRHRPGEFELELDAEGWVPVDQLLDALRRQPRWAGTTRADLEAVVGAPGRRRYELAGDRVRAAYGHTLPGRVARDPVVPPPELFHGTGRAALPAILAEGLHPRGRQYVHLSRTRELARQVGRRKDRRPAVVEVDAAAAAAAGVVFYAGAPDVLLADHVPAAFLRAAGA